MSFVIKKLDEAKTATYKITIEAESSKTGLKSSSVLTIAYKVQPPALGKGGSENIFSAAAMDFIHKKVGVGGPDTWELCYSAAKHGFNSHTFRSRCLNKGPLFYFQKRKANNWILGGNVHVNAVDNNNGYLQTGNNNEPKAWLFSINPSNPDKVMIARKCRRQYQYYFDNDHYLMCFGGGHDQCCRTYDGHCWGNPGHDYCPDVSGDYGHSSWQKWAGNDYGWDGRNDLYEVYRVIA
jgi:hypothetical protein